MSSFGNWLILPKIARVKSENQFNNPLKKTVLLEMAYFPTVEYLAIVAAYPSVILESCEHFQKNSFRNRARIATANGVQTLSVPLKKGKNSQQPIQEVLISYEKDWQRAHWKTIQTAYGNAPFWTFYAPIFERLFTEKFDALFDLNVEILKTFLKILKIEKSTTLSLSTTYERVYTEGADFRKIISPKNPPLTSVRYAQVFEDRHGFLPHLSALDLIFCAGNHALDVLQKTRESQKL